MTHSPATCHHEVNLNAIVEGAWTLMVIDQDDRRTFAWAAGEIDELRAACREAAGALTPLAMHPGVGPDCAEIRAKLLRAACIMTPTNREDAPPC